MDAQSRIRRQIKRNPSHKTGGEAGRRIPAQKTNTDQRQGVTAESIKQVKRLRDETHKDDRLCPHECYWSKMDDNKTDNKENHNAAFRDAS